MAATQTQQTDTLNIQSILGVLSRRRLLFLIPFFVGWLVVWIASWVLPPRYKSATLIIVEQPTMPKDYVVPNVAENLQERLQSITQQILSRSRLLQIADELNLYAKERVRMSPDDIVEHMRKNIDIELVRGGDNRISAFNVSYTADNPYVAQRVTSKLTNLFISENLEVRQQESEGNTKFLEDQLRSAQQVLEAQEERIRQFKAQHVGELPSQLNSNLQILSGLQSQLQAQAEALNTTKQQRVYLQTLIGQYRALRGPSKDSTGQPVGIAEIDDQLDKLRTKLRELSSTYNDQYPEIRELKAQIAKTEVQREQLLATLKAQGNKPQPEAADASAGYSIPGSKDPSSLAQLQSQLQANDIEIANRERSIAALTAKLNEYNAKLSTEPIREQQLADLTRGYDQSKASYDSLLKKKNDSAMATSMELLKQGERFRIIDPPSLPLKPTFPDRLKFCGMGLMAGLALGVAFVVAAEMLDERVYSEIDLRKLLPGPVLCELPVIPDPADDARQHRQAWLTWATTGIVVAGILTGSAVSYLKR